MKTLHGWMVSPHGAADYVRGVIHKERPLDNPELYVRVTVTVDEVWGAESEECEYSAGGVDTAVTRDIEGG